MSEICSVDGCDADRYRELPHPDEGGVKRQYCKRHTASALVHWGAVKPEEPSFPPQSKRPTSRVPELAKDDSVQHYQVLECVECGSEAYAKPLGGSAGLDAGIWVYACRTCQFGSEILAEHSYYGSVWHRVREWILDRDENTCQKCGEEQDRLHIHHKKKLVYCETVAEANEPDNLITLCTDCHEESESIQPVKRIEVDF